MESNKNRFNSVDEYIATFPEDVRKILVEPRVVIKASAPDAEGRTKIKETKAKRGQFAWIVLFLLR